MTIELGIALALTGADATPAALEALARRAEAGGLDLVVVGAGVGDGSGAERSGLDPWTTAVWLAGRTERIQIGVASPVSGLDPADPEAPYPAVVDKAHQSLDALAGTAGTRLITAESAWVTAPADAGPDQLRALAASGLPVVVPVRSGSTPTCAPSAWGTLSRRRCWRGCGI